jgi:MoxR-like ATPase
VITPAQVLELRRAALGVKLSDALLGYLLAIVGETREHEAIALGASTRAALALRRAAQVHALLDERDYAIPEDVQLLAVDVLSHRIALAARAGAPGATAEARWLLREIVERVPVPL